MTRRALSPLLLLWILVFPALAWCQEDNGALGLGVVSESDPQALVSINLRGSLFLDVGVRVVRPVFLGFEMAADVKHQDEGQLSLEPNDVSDFGLASGDPAFFQSPGPYRARLRLWDLAFSPRLTASLDLRGGFQILTFAGLYADWQGLSYSITRLDGAPFGVGGSSVPAGGSYEGTAVRDWELSGILGVRLSWSLLYVETAGLLQGPQRGSWNRAHEQRTGMGLSLRF